jgi:hypothetical protein
MKLGLMLGYSGATGLTHASLQPEGMELMAELSGSRDRRRA